MSLIRKSLAHGKAPLSRILHVLLEGVGESCKASTIEVSMITHPSDVHDLSRHQLHLGVVARKSHRPAGGSNDSLAIKEDRTRILGADHTDVRKSDGSTLDVLQAQLSSVGISSNAHHFLLDFQDVEVANILDVGHHEAMRRVDSNRDVVAAILGVVGRVCIRWPKLGVDLGIVIEGQGHGLEHERGHRDFGAVLLQCIVLERFLQGQDFRHVDFLAQCHEWNFQGCFHGLHHALAHIVGDLNHDVLSAPHRRSEDWSCGLRSWRSGLRSWCWCCLEVLLQDTAHGS
mmetsp:Transcript_93219/g.165763  ORF Transcript_93219/g.165763 Transcript_93219/m.165763 type:complete len:287 (+) Transcript_93219:161-1021(+)